VDRHGTHNLKLDHSAFQVSFVPGAVKRVTDVQCATVGHSELDCMRLSEESAVKISAASHHGVGYHLSNGEKGPDDLIARVCVTGTVLVILACTGDNADDPVGNESSKGGKIREGNGLSAVDKKGANRKETRWSL
jgi:hypothetical protein